MSCRSSCEQPVRRLGLLLDVRACGSTETGRTSGLGHLGRGSGRADKAEADGPVHQRCGRPPSPRCPKESLTSADGAPPLLLTRERARSEGLLMQASREEKTVHHPLAVPHIALGYCTCLPVLSSSLANPISSLLSPASRLRLCSAPNRRQRPLARSAHRHRRRLGPGLPHQPARDDPHLPAAPSSPHRGDPSPLTLVWMLQTTRTMRAAATATVAASSSSSSSASSPSHPTGRPTVASVFRAMTLNPPVAQLPQPLPQANPQAKPALRIETATDAAKPAAPALKKRWSWRIRRNSKAAAAITGASRPRARRCRLCSLDLSRLTSP